MRRQTSSGLTRRKLLRAVLIGSVGGGLGWGLMRHLHNRPERVFIGTARSYEANLTDLFLRGFSELGLARRDVQGKTLLLKPNLVEPQDGLSHINTNPILTGAAAEAFLKLGAGRVVIGEGPGHRRDTLLVLEVSGLRDVLRELRLEFADLNDDADYDIANVSSMTRLRTLSVASALAGVDWVVSLAKMKTHHWTGVSLSMKNLFGIMPGIVYGWPKNVFHYEGIVESILDINASIRPHFAIVDGIVGMEGDGPILGTPRNAGVIVMGRNPTAVDATCARVMGIRPERVPHLAVASGWLGPTSEEGITQTGEPVLSVRTDFQLIDAIPAQRALRP